MNLLEAGIRTGIIQQLHPYLITAFTLGDGVLPATNYTCFSQPGINALLIRTDNIIFLVGPGFQILLMN